MNNKMIIAIVCFLVAVCLSVGIGMNIKGSNSQEEANSISNKETVSSIDDGADSSNSINEETGSNASVKGTSSTDKTETHSKKAEEKTQVSTKSEGSSEKKTEAKQTSVKATQKTSAKTEAGAEKTEKETQAQIQVMFSVNCEKAVDYGADYPKYLIGKTKCSVKKGTTVFDLLSEACSKKGLAVVHQNKSYVVSIGGLAEKDCGSSSGWMYMVNGVKLMMSASKYVLKDGDTIEWYYVTSSAD